MVLGALAAGLQRVACKTCEGKMTSVPSGAALEPEFIVSEHPRAPGKVNEDKLHRSLQLAAQELHVSGELQSSV
jgi:hypothetical protein